MHLLSTLMHEVV